MYISVSFAHAQLTFLTSVSTHDTIFLSSIVNIQGASDTEDQRLNNATDEHNNNIPPKAPPARTCCGNVAYTVGANSAAAVLKKQGEVSVATQHFHNVNKEKKKKDSCCIQ